MASDQSPDPLRHQEYYPEKAYHRLSKEKQQQVYGYRSPRLMGDEYLKFIVTELKPYIDQHYSVHTDAAHTAVMGSSMGGLISMYAISEYPDIFGQAACMSTHWPGITWAMSEDVPESFLSYMRDHLPSPKTHRLYFDLGDQTLDQYYPPLQAAVDQLVQQLGYDETNWLTVYDKGAAHKEDDWKKRLPIAFKFLFGKEKD